MSLAQMISDDCAFRIKTRFSFSTFLLYDSALFGLINIKIKFLSLVLEFPLPKNDVTLDEFLDSSFSHRP